MWKYCVLFIFIISCSEINYENNYSQVIIKNQDHYITSYTIITDELYGGMTGAFMTTNTNIFIKYKYNQHVYIGFYSNINGKFAFYYHTNLYGSEIIEID